MGLRFVFFASRAHEKQQKNKKSRGAYTKLIILSLEQIVHMPCVNRSVMSLTLRIQVGEKWGKMPCVNRSMKKLKIGIQVGAPGAKISKRKAKILGVSCRRDALF